MYISRKTKVLIFLLLAVTHIGKAYDAKTDFKWKLLYILAFIFLAEVFLNDFYQKAFFFTEGLENWEDHYVHGTVCFLSLLWMVLMFRMALVITIKKCTSMEGLIQARLFPSNDCYDEMWRKSDICDGIVDSQGRILCADNCKIFYPVSKYIPVF